MDTFLFEIIDLSQNYLVTTNTALHAQSCVKSSLKLWPAFSANTYLNRFLYCTQLWSFLKLNKICLSCTTYLIGNHYETTFHFLNYNCEPYLYYRTFSEIRTIKKFSKTITIFPQILTHRGLLMKILKAYGIPEILVELILIEAPQDQ